MARPIKNNADYFPHDADMRNDPRVKALRRKFGVEGYGIYSMVVEYLTHSEHFQAKFDKLGVELMAGDFDIETDKLQTILKYCTELDLIQNDKGVLFCKSLEKRLNPLLSKRERDREYIIANDKHTVKKSKVKESKGEESESKEYGTTHEHFIIIKSKYLHESTIRINGKDGLIEYMEANQTVLNLPQFAEKYMRSAKGKVFNELSHLQNHYALYIEKLHQ